MAGGKRSKSASNDLICGLLISKRTLASLMFTNPKGATARAIKVNGFGGPDSSGNSSHVPLEVTFK